LLLKNPNCAHRHGNDFSAWGAKIGEKQSRQSDSKSGKAPEAGEFSRIFVLKVKTLQHARLLLTVIYRKYAIETRHAIKEGTWYIIITKTCYVNN